MKALSIRQPWAWLIANGHKDIENRTWKHPFTGNFQIHASKGLTEQEYKDAIAFVKKFNPALAVQIPEMEKLPLGGIVGIARITRCVFRSKSPWFVGPFGFVLEDAYPLPIVKCRGALGFFDPEIV
jgi:hypothetical protein